MLQNAQMIQFGQLCSLLGVSGGKMGGVLEAVMGCCVLVQGCWVILPEVEDLGKRNARDYNYYSKSVQLASWLGGHSHYCTFHVSCQEIGKITHY